MKYFLVISLFLFSQIAVAVTFEIKTDKDSVLIKVTDTGEINKLNNYNGGAWLKYTDAAGKKHNLNPDKTIEISELP